MSGKWDGDYTLTSKGRYAAEEMFKTMKMLVSNRVESPLITPTAGSSKDIQLVHITSMSPAVCNEMTKSSSKDRKKDICDALVEASVVTGTAKTIRERDKEQSLPPKNGMQKDTAKLLENFLADNNVPPKKIAMYFDPEADKNEIRSHS